MLTSVFSFICLLFYSVIVSQSFSYIISLTDVQAKMKIQEYIPFRQATDKNFRAKFTYVVYGALLSNLALVIVTIICYDPVMLAVSAIAFIVLIIDTSFTLKGNMPINNAINTWTVENYPADWETQRANWLQYFRYRQIANITGFVCLTAGIVFA